MTRQKNDKLFKQGYHTTKMWRDKLEYRFTVRLTEVQIEKLNKLARLTGKSRSWLLQDALDIYARARYRHQLIREHAE